MCHNNKFESHCFLTSCLKHTKKLRKLTLKRCPFDFQDIPKAKEIFEKAAEEEGHPDAQFFQGFLHATGTSVNSSQSKALLHYSFAAFGGSSFAQMALGYRYWAGVGVATSCEKALDYYRRVVRLYFELQIFLMYESVMCYHLNGRREKINT